MKVPACLLLVVIGVGSAACTAGTDRDNAGGVVESPIAAEVLYSGTKCGHPDPGVAVSLVTDELQLAKVYSGFRKQVFGLPPMTLPEVNFKRDIVLLVEMGLQPTLGFRLMLMDHPSPRIVAQHAEVTLEWITPPPNMVVGEMLTSPCLLLKLTRGPYQEVWINDHLGQHRAVLTVP